MKKILSFAIAGLMAVSVLGADKAEKTKGWIDNFEKAKTEAKASKQPILAMFTGSDWCGWCIRLHKEVLDTPPFTDYAAKNLVLFVADFPRAKPLTDEVKKQNQELAAKYGVRGYPTLYLLDAEGNVLGQTGYLPGGPDAYISNLKALLAKGDAKKEAETK